MSFKWEHDVWWWEKLRFDEFGLPDWLNIVVPDKLFHFLITFFLTLVISKFLNRHWSALIAVAIMCGPWEIVWDGCFRYGASWKDMVANVLGALVCWWWLSNPVVGQSE